jgi:broad specificity phosphatase PhoE
MTMEQTGRLVLVRHGETEWSRDHKHTSFTDLPLTETGAEQARALGKRLGGFEFAAIFVSPLLRARQTCELAGFGARAEVLDDLYEWNYGEYEGLTTAEIRKSRPGWTVWNDGPLGGESPAEVASRADRVILGAVLEGRDVALFAHGHMLRVIAARWIGLPASGGARLRLETATVSTLGYERDTRVILTWNA